MRVCLLGTMFRLVYQQNITLGEFFSLYFYSFYIFSPLYLLGEVMKNYQEAKASHELLQELLAQPPEQDMFAHSDAISKIDSITFDHVSFSYLPEKEILHSISVRIERGQTIAFVGPSGSGKSTIVKLLLGLYPPTAGKILIDGKSVDQYVPKQLKALVGLVAQDTQLFSGTVRQNLHFVKPTASDEEMMTAIGYAQLQELISTAGDLELKIGEGGLKLSGGQKQRLAIARALLRNPQLLIFDEATSSLDSLVEADITETIKEISKQKQDIMTILIAHRLSTVVHADVIYVLEKGHLIEQGSHDQLLTMK